MKLTGIPTQTSCALRRQGGARVALLIILASAVGGCDAPGVDDYPWLNTLDPHDGVAASGARLMALPFGLHALEPTTNTTEMLVGVHGFDSAGYEWVYPLQTLDAPHVGVWFFRWDFDGCPQPGADRLIDAIRTRLTADTAKIHLMGHSYGGLLLAQLVENWPFEQPVEIHIIASPLAGMPGANRCGHQPPTSIANKVTLFQWRTRHELDGAFQALVEDPQNISLAGSHVTRLPETYRDHRLGHNWSISWVADAIAAQRESRKLQPREG